MLFEYDEKFKTQGAIIKVLGIGGAGCNAINRMIESNMQGVEFIAINTDVQDLAVSRADIKLQIGREETNGLGAGAKPEIARRAVKENIDQVQDIIKETDMVCITAGMGGGTGTGAAPIIAQAARDRGCLTLAIVTMPFEFEGPNKHRVAEKGLQEIKNNVDTLIVVPNQQLIKIVDSDTSFDEALHIADNILHQAVKSITDLINSQGVFNLDFADVKTIMKDKGEAIMGTGVASGEARASLAAQQAISSPLLDNTSIQGANGILINIIGDENLTLFEVEEACKIIREEAGTDSDTIVGIIKDEDLEDEIVINVIATGVQREEIDESLPTMGETNYQEDDEIEEKKQEKEEIEEEPVKKQFELENNFDEEENTFSDFSSGEKEYENKQKKREDKEIPSIIRKNMKLFE
ncbi:MAG: cell division protein FtsZ [Candidatus Marinimicrobia bacterium]|nr:cell division protein FtsZ [Candidatus Neomarinimicrobiota bacterium]